MRNLTILLLSLAAAALGASGCAEEGVVLASDGDGDVDGDGDSDGDVEDDGDVDGDADGLEAPLHRVLFLVDVSESMLVIDPVDGETGMTAREAATRLAIEQMFETFGTETLSVAVIRFSSEAQVLTFGDENGNGSQDVDEGYYASDLEHLVGTDGAGGVVTALSESDRTSNLAGALGTARFVLTDEMAATAEPLRASTLFTVVLVSDFMPDIEGGGEVPDFPGTVTELVELGSTAGVGAVTFNCAYIRTGRATVDEPAMELGDAMAVAGGGHLRTFETAEELDIDYLNVDR